MWEFDSLDSGFLLGFQRALGWFNMQLNLRTFPDVLFIVSCDGFSKCG